MSYMTLSDLLLVLEDFRKNKSAALADTLAYRLYGPTLDGLFDQASSVQDGLSKKPLSAELKAADLIHDMSAKAVYYIAKGLLGLPDLAAESRAVLQAARDIFVPTLAPLSHSYEDEAAAAKKRAGALESMRTQLEAFPVAPNTTLYTLISAYLDAGKKIDTLLSARAETVAEDEASRVKDAGPLRSQLIGTLNRFRDALTQEVSVNAALPQNLVEITFSYYDQLTATREGRSAKPAAETPTSTEPTAE